MKPKILKVNCSFCGIEIECPEEMKDMEKHLCFNCFQNLSEHEFEDIEKSMLRYHQTNWKILYWMH